MFWTYGGSPNSRLAWILVTIFAGSLFFLVGLETLYSKPDCTSPIDATRTIVIRVVDVDNDRRTEKRIREQIETVKAWLPDVSISFRNQADEGEPPRLTVILSNDYPFSGRSGRTSDG